MNAPEWLNKTHVGDCRVLMRRMITAGVKVQCIVTSPPYWGLRDYGVAGQFGLERSWVRHVARMRGVFRLVRELLADDGTLWLNYGDCYAGVPGGWQDKNGDRASRTFTARIALEKKGRVINRRSKQASNLGSDFKDAPHRRVARDLKPKDLVGMPWRVAFALQADGWWLRSEIIWAKPNPMPESIKDRPTKSHEHLFLLSRSDCYYYNAEAIKEPSSPNSHERASRARLAGYAPPGREPHQGIMGPRPGVNPKAVDVSGWAKGPGSHAAMDHAKQKFRNGSRYINHVQDPRDSRGPGGSASKYSGNGVGFGHGYDTSPKPRIKQNESFSGAIADIVSDRNARTVWTIPTQPFAGAHFATFPQDLVARCILSGSRPGDIVFDPFMGSGTVAQVATDLGRHFIGCELSQEYVDMHDLRRTTTGMPL